MLWPEMRTRVLGNYGVGFRVLGSYGVGFRV